MNDTTLKPIFIFTWKPEHFSWDSFEKNKSGEVINWITVTGKINQGDKFILCRTGQKSPGIVAFGDIAGDPFKGTNYRKEKSLLGPLKIQGCICKKDSPALVPREFLKSYFRTPSSVWAPQGSGTRLKDVFYPWLEENLFSTTQQTSLKELSFETDDIPTDERGFRARGDQDYARPIYALDSTTISVCLSRFQWAHYRRAKGGFKLHTVLDQDMQMPVVMNMTTGNRADVKEAKKAIEALKTRELAVVMDRGYNDYELFMWLNERGTKFVTRIKDNALTTRLKDDVIEECEQYGDYGFQFSSPEAKKICANTRFRLIQWHDQQQDRWFEFLTNDFTLKAPEIAELYRKRWQIELFFKKHKHNLKIKSFIGTSENAVMMQIWTAAVATMLIEILRRLSRYSWSFSRLLKFVGLNLLTYKKLNVWINRPDFRSDIDRSKEKRRQMTLEFE